MDEKYISKYETGRAVDQALDYGVQAKYEIETAKSTHETLDGRLDDLQEQINQIVRAPESGGDVAAEVTQARVGADSTVYSTLKDRLDNETTEHDKKENKFKENLDILNNFSPFNEGKAGFAMPMIQHGMINATTGEIETTPNRAYSDMVDITGKEAHLLIKMSNYIDFKFGMACYDSNGNHLGNVGYYTADKTYSTLTANTKKIRLVFAKNDASSISESDLEWLNSNSFIQYGNFMIDTSLKFHYSTVSGGGNAYDKYAFLGFSSSNKSSVILNPTGNIANLGVVFKGKRYLDSISNFSLDLSNCSINDNKLIYLDPVLKKFYVCDGLAPENYRTITDNCAFVGFVCIPAPSISSTSMQMSVNGVNVNPYYGEYKDNFKDLDEKTKIFSEFHYSIDTAGNNCLDTVPLLEFTSSNKASVTLSTRMDRFTICVGAKTYGVKLSDITLDTSGLSTGDNKLVYLDVDTKTLYVFDGTNPSSNSAKSKGFTFLGLVCIPIPEVSMCKFQMSVDGKNLMTSRGIELAGVRFQNKTFSVIGDSISRYNDSWGGQPAGTTGWGGNTYQTAGYPVSAMWWHRLSRVTGMTINTINANAGSCCSTGNPSRVAGCSDERTAALDNGVDPDYIICEMGTNDFLYGVDLGSYDGTTDVPSDISTFIGAYANMLKKIQTNYPFAKIYCCTIHQHTHDSYMTLSNNLPVIVNRDGITLRDYNKAIRDIAKLFGCGVIDFESCGLNIRNVANLTFDDSTTMHLHPTDVGQRMLSESAISVFR